MARPKKPQSTVTGTRAVVYLRVSKEDGPTKHGLDVQRDICSRYVAERVYSVVNEVVDDGVSGAKRWQDRPGLSRAVQVCVDRAADVIVAYHQDRFARKMGAFDDLRDVALLKGFRLETASDGRVLTRPDDFITGDVQALVAAIERRRISERFQAARRRRSLIDGMGSGPLPWGYCRVASGAIAIDERAAKIIRRLFQLRAAGTYQATADALNKRGDRAPRGGLWTVGQVQAIERHHALYATGVRTWDGVTASLRWPVILEP